MAMLEPLGTERHSVVTSLGTIIYYTPTRVPWNPPTASDAPTLVFLHGFGGGSSAYEWSQVYPAFASDYRAIAPDLLGWGRSDRPERSYRPDDYITTILEFLDRAGGDRPLSVVASSLTAAFVIRAAIQRRDRFQSLILVAPSGLGDFGAETVSPIARLVSTPGLDRLLYQVAIANPAGIRTFLESRQFARPDRICEEIVRAYALSASQPNADRAALSFVRGDLSFDLARYLPQLETPTAIM